MVKRSGTRAVSATRRPQVVAAGRKARAQWQLQQPAVYAARGSRVTAMPVASGNGWQSGSSAAAWLKRTNPKRSQVLAWRFQRQKVRGSHPVRASALRTKRRRSLAVVRQWRGAYSRTASERCCLLPAAETAWREPAKAKHVPAQQEAHKPPPAASPFVVAFSQFAHAVSRLERYMNAHPPTTFTNFFITQTPAEQTGAVLYIQRRFQQYNALNAH
jgi:hypothetical protein